MPLDLPERLQALPQKKLSFSTENIDGSLTINSIEKSRISRESAIPQSPKIARKSCYCARREISILISLAGLNSRLIVAAPQWSRLETTL
jgi:hypothetical protein